MEEAGREGRGGKEGSTRGEYVIRREGEKWRP